MFEHPQLVELRRRKWNLVAQSAALRDDLQVEVVALERWSTWVELGIQIVALSGKRFNWTWGLFGLASVWVYKNVFTQGGDFSVHPSFNRIMGISQKVIAGWRLFNNVKEFWRSKFSRKPLELE